MFYYSFFNAYNFLVLSQIHTISGIINVYKEVVSISTFDCITEIRLNNTTNLRVGDTFLIIQMQGSIIDTNNTANFGNLIHSNNVGVFEYNIIDSISSNKVYIKNILENNYIISNKVQLVKTPSYQSAKSLGILSSLDWDGNIGGIFSIMVKDTFYLDHNIEMNGKGFRGGTVIISPCCFWDFMDYSVPNTNLKGAMKGESIAMYNLNYNRARGANANGDGGGNDHNAGGGGGSNATSGGIGGCENATESDKTYNGGIGGKPQSFYFNECKLIQGGGGGAGHMNSLDATGTNGGDGGGIIIISCKYFVSNNATINNCGDSVFIVANLDAGGGGGGGGTILLDCPNDIIGNLTINLNGGNGGKSTYSEACLGPGGGGSGGVLLTNNSRNNINLSLKGGNAGYLTMRPSCGTYCATNGEDGLYRNSIECYLEKLNLIYNKNSKIDSIICLGDSIILDYSAFDSVIYNDTYINPIRTIKTAGNYIVTLYSNCKVFYDTIQIDTQLCLNSKCEVKFPTAFTPNYDGINDLFKIYSVCTFEIYEFKIFNRWGELVFQTNDHNQSWDGIYKNNIQENGVYAWYLNYKFHNDNTRRIATSNVTIIK